MMIFICSNAEKDGIQSLWVYSFFMYWLAKRADVLQRRITVAYTTIAHYRQGTKSTSTKPRGLFLAVAVSIANSSILDSRMFRRGDWSWSHCESGRRLSCSGKWPVEMVPVCRNPGQDLYISELFRRPCKIKIHMSDQEPLCQPGLK